MSHFAGDTHVVGRDVRLNAEPYRIVGVLPADFDLPARDISVLVPFSFTPAQTTDNERGNEFSSMIARLRPGATIDQVNAQIKTIVDRNLDRLPNLRGFAESSGFGGYAVDMRQQIVQDVRTPLYILQVGVVLVLLIACANVANLLLMRATGRSREIAIRTTLGAGQGRLVKQMVVEGLVLSSIGGACGLGLGLLGVTGLVALSSQGIPGVTGVTLDPAILAFTIALSVVTGLVFGVVPAIAVIRGNVASMLKEDATRGSASRRTGATRALLVIAETAIAVTLLIGAGLLVKSFARIQDVNPGFATDHVLTAQVALPAARYPDAAARRAFWQRLTDKLRAMPGVTAAGLTTNVPFNGSVSSGSYRIVGYTPGPSEASPHGRQEIVGADYFRVMQIPVIEGRVFNDGDTADSPPVVVVDQLMANRYFPGRSAIGQELQRFGPNSPKMRIVGVVGTINAIDLGVPVTKERIYQCATQNVPGMMSVVLKTGVEPSSLVAPLREAVQSIDPEQAISAVRTMDEWVGRSLETRRAPMLLLSLFGAVAMVLSAIGIYGVLAFGVAQRVREFGIRQALGAGRREILALVFSQGLRTAGVGVVLGLAASLGLSRYLQSQLFNVGARDLSVFAGVTVVLLLVAAAACYVPARRATRVDPMVALRDA
jgi:predicted permease